VNMVWYVWLPLLGLIAILLAFEVIVRRRHGRMKNAFNAFFFRKPAEKPPEPQEKRAPVNGAERAPRGDRVPQRHQ
jgi:hypothetical protein